MLSTFSKILFSVLALSSMIACAPVHNATGSASSESLSAESAEIFSNTVFPIIETNCTLCHDGGGTGAVAFALEDANDSQNALLNFGLIDLDDPASSKIVTKIAGSHNGISTDISVQLSDALEDWIFELAETE